MKPPIFPDTELTTLKVSVNMRNDVKADAAIRRKPLFAHTAEVIAAGSIAVAKADAKNRQRRTAKD